MFVDLASAFSRVISRCPCCCCFAGVVVGFSMACSTAELRVRTSSWAWRMSGDPAVDSCWSVTATTGLAVLVRWMLASV